jgi:hypothetical protein
MNSMPINPVQFAHAVCDEFLRCRFSAFPLSDPELGGEKGAKRGQAHILANMGQMLRLLPAMGPGTPSATLTHALTGGGGPGDAVIFSFTDAAGNTNCSLAVAIKSSATETK